MEETRTARFDAATLARFGAVARCLGRIGAESRLDAVARFGAVASERMCEINQQFLFSIAAKAIRYYYLMLYHAGSSYT